MLRIVKKYIINSSNIHSLAGNVVFGITGLILFLLMVHQLDKALYGQWIIFITASTLLDMMRFGLSGTGAIRAIATSTGLSKINNIASSYHINIISTLIISALFMLIYFLLGEVNSESYYSIVFLYYPILAIANISHQQSNTYSQGIDNFKRILIVRGSVGILGVLFVGGYIMLFPPTIEGIIITYILVNFGVSVFTFIMKWDGRQYLHKFCKQTRLSLLYFGKYSTFSFIGSNLLRSSDTIILSLSAYMGAEVIAIYAIPLKFIELIEIPLRSFTATSFPKLSSAIVKSKDHFNQVLIKYLSFTIIFLIPIIGMILLLSGYLLPLIGGEEYSDSIELQKNLLFIIMFYILLLPFDRYSGMALFAINQPKQNFYKIMIMLSTNIIFDCVAVFVFRSIEAVALATVVFTFIGVVYGWYKINAYTKLSFKLFSDVLIGFYNKYILTYINS